MPKTLVEELASRLAKAEARLDALSGDRLGNASLDGTTLWLKDDDGNRLGRVGRQADGSIGVIPINSPPPPQVTAPILTVGDQAGTCLCKWDGETFDGRSVPIVFGHIEIWAERVDDDWSATVAPSDAAERVGSIRDRKGGEVTIALPQVGTWAVWLRMVAADRERMGPWSPVSTVEIVGNVDVEAIQEELVEARREREEYQREFEERTAVYDQRLAENENALAETDAWAASSMYRAEQAAGEAALSRVQADEAVREALDAQSKYDEVSTRQDATEQEIADARAAAQAAHEAAGAAYEYAVSIGEQVDGIGRSVRSTTPPTGTAPDGTFWRQYNNMSRERRLMGWWEFRDGAWDQISLDRTILPMVEIGQGVADDFRVQRLFAETGEVERLLVGDGENLLPEEMLWEFRDERMESPAWTGSRGGSGAGWTTATNRGDHPIRLRWQGDQGPGGTSRLNFCGKDGKGIPVKPGDTFMIRMNGWSATTGLSLQVRYAHEDSSFIQRVNLGTLGANFDHTWTVPEDGAIRRMEIEFTASASASAGNADWGDIEVRRGMAGELIVDGIMRATEAAIRRLFTDETVANIVWAEIVRAGLIEADEAFIGGALIRNETITVDKLYALEEIMSELGRFLKIEAGQLASNDISSMRIISSLIESTVYRITDQEGRETVRLDGMDNFFRGRFEAELDDAHTIRLDSGEIQISSATGEDEPNVSTHQSGYIEWEPPGEYRALPSIMVRENTGMMTIQPGYRDDTPSYRGRMNVLGDSFANDHYSRRDANAAWVRARSGYRADDTASVGRTPLLITQDTQNFQYGRESPVRGFGARQLGTRVELMGSIRRNPSGTSSWNLLGIAGLPAPRDDFRFTAWARSGSGQTIIGPIAFTISTSGVLSCDSHPAPQDTLNVFFDGITYLTHI